MPTTGERRLGVGAMGASLGALLVGLVAVTIGPGGLAGASGSGSGSVKAELAQAKTELLVKADLPKSWKGQGSVSTDKGSSPDTFPGEDQLAGCLGVAKSILEQNAPSVTSPSFENSSQTDYAQENLSIFATAKEGQVQYASLANPKVPACMTALLQGPQEVRDRKLLSHGVKGGDDHGHSAAPGGAGPPVDRVPLVLPGDRPGPHPPDLDRRGGLGPRHVGGPAHVHLHRAAVSGFAREAPGDACVQPVLTRGGGCRRIAFG